LSEGRKRWGAVPLDLLADPVSTGRALKVFTALSAMQGRHRRVQESLGAIASLAHVDERHTRRAVALLEQAGWIRRTDEPGKASTYEVLMARAGPGEGQKSPGCFSPPRGQKSPGRNGPPSPCLPPSPPLRSSPEESAQAEAAKGEPEGEAAAAGNVTPVPEGFVRWRLRLNREIGRSLLDKPKTRAAFRGLQEHGLSGDEALAYAVAEWHALPEPRQPGHLVQAVLDGDHLEAWLARRARRRSRATEQAELELGSDVVLRARSAAEIDEELRERVKSRAAAQGGGQG